MIALGRAADHCFEFQALRPGAKPPLRFVWHAGTVTGAAPDSVTAERYSSAKAALPSQPSGHCYAADLTERQNGVSDFIIKSRA
eukprot:260619-Hanusia_phi.AAC.1